MDKAKLQEVIDEKKAELFPITRKLDQLMDEENRLHDIIHDAQKRLREIKSNAIKQAYEYGVVISGLRHNTERLERIIN